MPDITVIATVHKERGFCNSNELLKIIEQIAPDIIFEERSHESFAKIYSGAMPDSLELNSIKRYLQKQSIPHIPVDIDINKLIDRRLHKDIIEMFNLIDNHPDYEKLSIQRETLTKQYGFSYLNSSHYKELMERIRILEEHNLRKINHEKLNQVYEFWMNIIDRRENEMIMNIYSHSTINKYKRALFLVGAAHRNPIMNKIPTFEKNSKDKLNWNCNYFN